MQVMEHIMPGLKYLAASPEPDSWLLVLSATRSLSRFDATRVTLAEAGMVAMLSTMKLNEDNVPAELIPGVMYSLAVTLSNLTCTEGVRERMIKDGAVQLLSSSLVDHALSHDDAFPETRTACAFALSNLTGSDLTSHLSKARVWFLRQRAKESTHFTRPWAEEQRQRGGMIRGWRRRELARV